MTATPEPRWPRLLLLWTFMAPHRRAVALGFVLGLLATSLSLASPLVTKWVLDALADGQPLTEPVVILGVLLVLGSILTLWQWILLGTVAERIVLDARESMVRRFFRARVPAITARPSGELVTRVTSDTVLLREAASSSVVELLNGAIALVGTLLLMAYLDIVLLGAIVIAIVIVAALFAALMPSIAKAHQETQESVGHLGGVLQGALTAIRTVKASRAEDHQIEIVVRDAQDATTHSVRAVRREATAWTIAWGGVNLAIIAILGVGAWRVSDGALEVSSLIAFLLYAFQLMGPITQLTQNVTTLQAGIAAAGRIREMQDMETEPVEPTAAWVAAAGPVDPDRAVIELRQVSLRYAPDEPPALQQVDLRIPRQGHTAVVGLSGAGKTTLLSLVLRFLDPQQGELFLDGIPYAALSHDEVRARLAYVEQETPVVPGTIRDNLLLAHPGATDEDLSDVLRAVRLSDKVASLEHGLDAELTPTSMSGGQRQRIGLARALLARPDVLLLDEATSQVDGLTEAAIHDAIRERSTHGAVVTIAHRLSTVVDADTIVVLDGGRVRDQGTHVELLERDELYRTLVAALKIGRPLDERGLRERTGEVVGAFA